MAEQQTIRNNAINKKITKKSNQSVQKRSDIIKTKNRTLTHCPFIPPQKRRGPIPCQKPYTIKHMLTECINLKQIFYQINSPKLLEDIKEAHIYKKCFKKKDVLFKNVH